MPRNISLALLSIAIAACAGYMNNEQATDMSWFVRSQSRRAHPKLL